jgi:hypothetical protein
MCVSSTRRKALGTASVFVPPSSSRPRTKPPHEEQYLAGRHRVAPPNYRDSTYTVTYDQERDA